MAQPDSREPPTRRALLGSGLAASAVFANPLAAFAAAPPGFDQWRERFRAHALAKGVSEATWARVMGRMAALAMWPFARRGYVRWMPPPFGNWTRVRDFPVPRLRGRRKPASPAPSNAANNGTHT